MNTQDKYTLGFMIAVCVVITILVNLVCIKFIEYKYKDELEKLSLIKAQDERNYREREKEILMRLK